ncbi:hypothetical protein GCM10010317_042610 [Streptomyces mirabilis]|nr:hypothetical protein GCM10010317_042610 [Streptomyces mirabilis]
MRCRGQPHSAWTAKEREAYANDLGDARALTAVSAAGNCSKSDQDPSTSQPPAQGYRCQNATDSPTEHPAPADPHHRARPLRPPTAGGPLPEPIGGCEAPDRSAG